MNAEDKDEYCVQNKLVSVVIPTYHNSKYLKQAIDSVIAQDYDNKEIIVVDDNGRGSEEQLATEKAVQEYGDKLKYLVHEKNRGGSAARNTGIKAATGDHVAFLDGDDYYLPGYLTAMMRELRQTQYNVSYEAQWYTDYGGICFCSKKHPPKIHGNIYNKVLSNEIPISIFLVFKKSVVENIGLFDENVRAYDDYDLWIRWSKILEFACVNEPYVVVRRESGNKSLTTDTKKMRLGLEYIKKEYFEKLNSSELKQSEIFLKRHRDRLVRSKLFQYRHLNEWKKLIKGTTRYFDSFSPGVLNGLMLVINLLFDNDNAVNIYKARIFRNRYLYLDTKNQQREQ